MLPLRLIVLAGGNQDSKTKFTEIICDDKKRETAKANRKIVAAQNVNKGRVVVFLPNTTKDRLNCTGIAKRSNFACYLVHLTFGEPQEVLEETETSEYSKVIKVKDDAELVKVAEDLKKELFGDDAPPIQLISKPLRVLRGDFNGELALSTAQEAVTKVFGNDVKVTMGSGYFLIGFPAPPVAHAALAKTKEIVVAGSTIVLRFAPPIPKSQKNNNAAAAATGAPKARSAPAPRPVGTTLKAVSIPQGTKSQQLRPLFEIFGKVKTIRLSRNGKDATIIMETQESAKKALAEKVSLDGVELKVELDEKKIQSKPVTPSKPAAASQKAAKKPVAASTAPAIPRLIVEGADPATSTKQDLEKLFGAFKGLVRVEQQRDRVLVSYDNKESVEEVLQAKEIVTDSGAHLTVRKDPSRRPVRKALSARRQNPQPPRTAIEDLIVSGLPASVTEEELTAVFSPFDPQVQVQLAPRKNMAFLKIMSPENRAKVLAQKHTLKDKTLFIDAPIPANLGVLIRGVNAENETQLREILKPFGDIVVMKFTYRSCKLQLKSPEQVQALLKAPPTLSGSKLDIQQFRQ